MRSYSLLSIAQWIAIVIPPAIIAGRAVADIGAIAVALLFLAHSIQSRDFSWLRIRWVQLLLLLWVCLCINALFAEEPLTALRHAVLWIRYPIFAAALSLWVLPDATTRHRLFISLSVSVAFIVADGWLQYSTGSNLFGRPPFPPEESPRLSGPFSKPYLGIMLTWLSFPVIVGLCLNTSYAWWLRIGGALLGLATLLLIFASGERMAFLLALMGCGLWLLLCFKLHWKMLLPTGLVIVAVVALALNKPALIERQVASTQHVINNLWESPYGMIWQSSFAIIAKHPFTGIGNRMFRIYCPRAEYGATDAATLEHRCNLHPHNIYIELLVSGGIIAFTLFVTAMLYLLSPALRHHRAFLTHPIALGLLITLLIRLWPISATTSFFISWSAVPFWVIVGWWWAQLRMLTFFDKETFFNAEGMLSIDALNKKNYASFAVPDLIDKEQYIRIIDLLTSHSAPLFTIVHSQYKQAAQTQSFTCPDAAWKYWFEYCFEDIIIIVGNNPDCYIWLPSDHQYHVIFGAPETIRTVSQQLYPAPEQACQEYFSAAIFTEKEQHAYQEQCHRFQRLKISRN